MTHIWTTKLSQRTAWPTEISNREDKQRVADLIVSYARAGDVIGLGSGSTAYLALQAIAKAKLDVTFIPTSYEMEHYAQAFAQKIASIRDMKPDWCFDGADEVDEQGNMIKGRGGAMLREKIVMRSAGKILIAVDHSKLVKNLGEIHPIPVAVMPDALYAAEEDLYYLGAESVHLRMATGKDGPVITEQGHFILDVRFETVLPHLAQQMASIVGVVETGLFMDFNPIIVTPDTTDLVRD
jgi:ribose 5-phosphate isomerase A